MNKFEKVFGLEESQIWIDGKHVKICFRKMNNHLLEYFIEEGYKVYQQMGFKILQKTMP